MFSKISPQQIWFRAVTRESISFQTAPLQVRRQKNIDVSKLDLNPSSAKFDVRYLTLFDLLNPLSNKSK